MQQEAVSTFTVLCPFFLPFFLQFAVPGHEQDTFLSFIFICSHARCPNPRTFIKKETQRWTLRAFHFSSPFP
jgi:hypothetical protein